MGKTYVIADIHGMLDLMELAISKIHERTVALGPKGHRVIFLGDYIDRGPQSAQCVAVIKGGIAAGKPWTALKGNHEDFMAAALIDDDKMMADSWVMNGGAQTLASYVDMNAAVHDAEWMKHLPTHHKDAHRVYVHAFAPEEHDLSDAPDHILMWARYPEKADVGYRGKHVVHGHTPKKNGPELYANRTNLDCGAVFGGRLVIGVFDDDKPGGPIELIEVSK